MSGSRLSTHVLDLDAGMPAAGMRVELLALADPSRPLSAVTDTDGRISAWPDPAPLQGGDYALVFYLADWYAARGQRCFFPRARIELTASAGRAHYHVPLLLNRHGYTTYRGS